VYQRCKMCDAGMSLAAGFFSPPRPGSLQGRTERPIRRVVVLFRRVKAIGSWAVAIAAGSSNGLTNNRCCRYSCLRSWWWVEDHPKHVEQLPYKINCVTLHLDGYILEYDQKC
jgi:hypothetical protein